MAFTDIDKPSDYFETKLYTGNGGTLNVTGLDFSPNWVWIKSRSSSRVHCLFDTVRSATKRLQSNEADTEYTTSNSLTGFNSDGFSLGSYNQSNEGSANFVSWNWKAGTSVSGNTGGSGTAKAYSGSVNTTSGISIIRYQGNGTNGHTIPHHLGVTPTVMMVKRLTGAAANWSNYQSDFWVSGGNQYIDLNRSAAAAADSVMWYNTQPTSSVFTVGTNERTNYNNDYFINYLFTPIQGYSKFSSYVGNGNADGTFVYTGFKPAWVMIKATNASKDWKMIDNKRNPAGLGGANPVRYRLAANEANTTSDDGDGQDFTSQGFKFRTTDSHMNGNGTQYLYMAFAEEPFLTSTGVPATAR